MDNQAQGQPRTERWGPELYVHLEFRVSWGGKKQTPPKNHQITYRSRGPRERTPAFPRQVPAPNTNYLAAIHTFEQRQSMIRELRHNYVHHNNNPNRHHQMQEYYQGDPPRAQLQVPIIREPQRPTRADGRPSSHERGRSAPPPIGENPWDVSFHPDQARTSDMEEPNRSAAAEIRRKPLPAPPSQFRLGEGGQPWSTWSLPDGYDPDTHPKDDDDLTATYNTYNTYDSSDAYTDLPVHSAAAVAAGAGAGADRNSTTYATNPTMVSTFSPEPTSPAPPRTRDLETGRARELGALSAAMMTVDNGFETQWWYQGPRASVALSDDGGGGDNNETKRRPSTPDESPAAYTAGVVSPMTEAAFSPAPPPPVG
ncbi:hypothetical protein NEMBOFW57_010531 [Staphylotrichum longicolle]|uniref:Uncharacterized protein n=1 Tax=Staphylotrichum longicolle TaxID=669026 RepID=A0AAD4EN84_9PEZI|nr:hypothetical protein NEMBOFW57_010531 [Staphylotrichum longicolle]